MDLILIFIIVPAIVFSLIYFLIIRRSPAFKGRRSEDALAGKLETSSFFSGSGKTIRNLYLPLADGNTTEIDLIHITSRGILVIENKNYAGYIFGSENSREWTVTLYGGKNVFGGKRVEKYRFYNPVLQNRTHINCLRNYVHPNVPLFSLIAFDDRSDLKSISIYSQGLYVCNHSQVRSLLNWIESAFPLVLNDEQINGIYMSLLPFTNVTKEARQSHVAYAATQAQTATRNAGICPQCGGALRLRTAKKGPYAGRSFYGCSNYPNCRFTRDL